MHHRRTILKGVASLPFAAILADPLPAQSPILADPLPGTRPRLTSSRCRS